MNTPQQGEWSVKYEVLSGMDGFTTPVSAGEVQVSASSEKEARSAARDWVHDNDVYADPRVDPLVRVLSVRRATSSEQ